MAKDFLWWRDGVVYQIYPRSFKDTTGSGIGDLNGIREKLGYLSDLGIDAIWLSPINPSPDVDFGYDVSDYRDVDPKFGTMQDFDDLVQEAGKLGIRIILDLVLNHSSDQHPWFLESKKSRDNPFRDYYIWHDPASKGGPPNNWRAVFGGRGWEWDETTGQYYYHMFYKEQPDVNWRNPKVRAEMLDVFRFWLDRGVKGFRLDVFNVYFKDDRFRSNPTKLLGRRPFDKQIHKYDFNRPELMGVLRDIRETLDRYDEAYAIGETFLCSPKESAAYCGDGLLPACFNFEILEARRDPRVLQRKMIEWEDALGTDKWPVHVLNNHDNRRYATRFGRGEDDARMKMAAAMLLTLRGTPFLYYGEEIGMRDIRVRRKDILDPIGKRYWPVFKGRDGCRAPMQWKNARNAGFSGNDPWLPVHPNYPSRNVQALAGDPESLLNTYKKMLALRKKYQPLIGGDLTFLESGNSNVMAYLRAWEDERMIVALNFSGSEQSVRALKGSVIFSTSREAGRNQGGITTLKGDEALILKVQ